MAKLYRPFFPHFISSKPLKGRPRMLKGKRQKVSTKREKPLLAMLVMPAPPFWAGGAAAGLPIGAG